MYTGFTGISAFRRISVLIKIILPLISVVGGDVTADVVGIISTSNRGVVCWAGGCYCPEPALLKRIRKYIYENIEEFTSIIREPEFIAEFPELDTDDKLKKVPAPFPADFPEADFLKHKHYDVMSVKPEAWFESDDLLQKVDAVFRKMYKFNRFFNYTIDNQ